MLRQTKTMQTVYLVARAGLWRTALESFLNAIPGLDVKVETGDLEGLPERLAEGAPQALLLEAELCGSRLTQLLEQIHAKFPEVHLIVLADTAVQYRLAESTGIGHVLMKSMLHHRLDTLLITHLRK